MCKNSLLLLKRKFLLRVGDKKIVFLIEFMFLLFYLFTLLQAERGFARSMMVGPPYK